MGNNPRNDVGCEGDIMKCPSCGREIPDDTVLCPYCTANVKKRIRLNRIYAVALSLLIIASAYSILSYAAAGIPVTKIKDLSMSDDRNFVRVKGYVVDYPRVYEGSYGVTALVFTINDGTGDLTVKIYRSVMWKVVSERKVPGMGDLVDVRGTFFYSTTKSITLNNPDYLVIKRPEFSSIRNLTALSNSPPWAYRDGEGVDITGNITGVREYSWGYILSVDELLDVIMPRAYVSLNITNLKNISSGISRFYGTLEYYRSYQPSTLYPVYNLSTLLSDPEKYNGTSARILWATVVHKDEANNTIFIDQNGTEICVYVSSGVRYYDVGEHVELQGKFEWFAGHWEIAIIRESDYIIEPKWELIAHPQCELVERKSYEATTEYHLCGLMRVEGIVADYTEYSSGSVSITLYNASYPGCVVNVYVEHKSSISGLLQSGSKVVVRGMALIYNGDWEIKVRAYTNDSVEVIY